MYTHFTKEKRTELAVLIRAKHSPQECANILGCNKSSVTREIRLNKCSDGIYRGAKANKRSQKRRAEAKVLSRSIQNNTELEKHIITRLKKRDSPEQIAGSLRLNKSENYACAQTIYQWIFHEHPEYKTKLRRISHKGKYRRRQGTKIREEAREEAKFKSIDTRPTVVEERSRLGDFEGDTVIGKDKHDRLGTHVDRKSGYGLIELLLNMNAEMMRESTVRRFKKIPKSKKHTYTYDNGTEIGKDDVDLEKKLGMDMYRANAYHSWERGTNENFNGLVRDFLPKGTDFAKLKPRDIKRIENNLNHRPRKRLGYLTPHDVFVLGKVPGAVQVRI